MRSAVDQFVLVPDAVVFQIPETVQGYFGRILLTGILNEVAVDVFHISERDLEFLIISAETESIPFRIAETGIPYLKKDRGPAFQTLDPGIIRVVFLVIVQKRYADMDIRVKRTGMDDLIHERLSIHGVHILPPLGDQLLDPFVLSLCGDL